MSIHSTAIIDKDVELGSHVEVGAYSIIRGKVKIGDNTVIKDRVTLYGPLTMGKGNEIHPGAVLGNTPQYLNFGDEFTEVIIGNNNIIRECVTIQRATVLHDRRTVLGDSNFIMAYTHVAHDCILGSNINIANAVQLAGHVIVHDYAFIGGIAGIHQFVTIGSHCMIGFLSRINKDVPPYMIMEGNPAEERGVNAIGLKRRNFSDQDIALLKKAFRVLFLKKRPMAERRELITSGEFANNAHVQRLWASIEDRAAGKNGRAQEGHR